MSYDSKNSNNGGPGIDLISPIVEILEELIKILLKLVKNLISWSIKKISSFVKRKYFGIYTSNPVEQKHLKSKKTTDKAEHLGYSASNKRNFSLSELKMGKHTAIIGSTGSGKSVCLQLLLDHALKSGKPVIYFDPKASKESVNTFRKMCHAQGKKLYLFTDISEDSTPFNPLIDGTLDDINDRIMNALEWSEPFYKNESIEALDDVLSALSQSGTPITFKNVVHELGKHANKKNIKGLINQLGKVSKSSYGDLLNDEGRDVLTFNKLRMENACIYIGISAMGHSSSGHILNKIFFGGILTHAKDSLIGKVPGLHDPESMPISVAFDELSSTVHEGFIDLQNKCRQAGIEITYATQGPADIDRISPTLTSQIFENTNNLFIFNQMVPNHTEFFARTIGTMKSEKKTQMVEDDEATNTGSVREVEEFIVHSNILRNLRVGQCVLMQRIPKRVDLLNIRHWRAEELDVPKQEQAANQADAVLN